MKTFFPNKSILLSQPIIIMSTQMIDEMSGLKATESKLVEYKDTLSRLDIEKLQIFVTKIYEKAYNALDIIRLIEDGHFGLDDNKRCELLIAFNKIRKEFRNEKLLIMFIMNFTFIDSKMCLENMTFI